MLRALIAVLNMLVSVAVPLGISAVAPNLFTQGTNYLFGVALFIALTILEIYVLAEKAFEKQLRIEKAWDAREELDFRLQEVRRLFHQVEERKVGDTDLFVSFFNKKLSDLELDLREACSKQEVRIDETMLEVTTWLLQSSFCGRAADVFRAILFTSDIEFFFDVHNKRYFNQGYAMVKSGAMQGVRRIIVYSDVSEIADPRVQKLIRFHQQNSGYECMTLPGRVFERIVKDYNLYHLVQDFGIYGESYLYKGVVNRSDEIIGYYSRDRSEIRRFIDCFQTCWESGTHPPEVLGEEGVSIEWLFADVSQLGTATPHAVDPAAKQEPR
jgi:hypothetical protein